MRHALLALMAAFGLLACSGPAAREYEVTGQVVAVDPARQEITIQHEDIPRFMPGMKMAFKVREARLLDGRAPGDLVKATLVVADADAHLRTLEVLGSAPVPKTAPPAGDLILDRGQPVADATLIDHDGVRRRVSDWRGEPIAVTFIYTRCPLATFCPLMDRNFKEVQDAVLDDPLLKGRVRLLSVSFDPEHDTPAVLASRAAAVRADPSVWLFVSGNQDEVERFASQFGVSIIRDPSAGTEIVHNLRTVVIDDQGRLATMLNGNDWTPADLVAALKRAH